MRAGLRLEDVDHACGERDAIRDCRKAAQLGEGVPAVRLGDPESGIA